MKKEKILCKKKISQAFETFDLDGDGFITQSEWQKMMGGLEMGEEKWTEFLGECDGNKDGKVLYIYLFFRFREMNFLTFYKNMPNKQFINIVLKYFNEYF